MESLYLGDALTTLKRLATGSIQTCVTSPPYFGLRDYRVKGQIGLEHSPEAFVARLVAVFREVHRVLRDDGTLWLNLGDSYSAGGRGGGGKQDTNKGSVGLGPWKVAGFASKQLLGIPWRVAFALQADGWYLRQDIIWHKPNPMPESVTDRCTKAHEYIFLLSKSLRYYYDCDAIREPYGAGQREAGLARARKHGYSGNGTYQDWYDKRREKCDWVDKKSSGDQLTYGHAMKASATKPPNLLHPLGRNKRSVWTVAPQSYAGAHFATFPPLLVEPCILAGAPIGGTVLDPFMGSGTTGLVANARSRAFVGIELNPEYIRLAKQRIGTAQLKRAA